MICISRPLHLQTDASGVSTKVVVLPVRPKLDHPDAEDGTIQRSVMPAMTQVSHTCCHFASETRVNSFFRVCLMGRPLGTHFSSFSFSGRVWARDGDARNCADRSPGVSASQYSICGREGRKTPWLLTFSEIMTINNFFCWHQNEKCRQQNLTSFYSNPQNLTNCPILYFDFL